VRHLRQLLVLCCSRLDGLFIGISVVGLFLVALRVDLGGQAGVVSTYVFSFGSTRVRRLLVWIALPGRPYFLLEFTFLFTSDCCAFQESLCLISLGGEHVTVVMLIWLLVAG